MKVRNLIFAFASSALIVGCAGAPIESLTPAPVTQAASAPAFPVDRLIGGWGVASYRDDKDKARTIAQARAQCKLPYVITKGPTDGVMMHVADDTSIHELTLKGAPGGKTYLGFAGPPGDDLDREVLSFTDNMFVVRYVNAETNTRYGTFIYMSVAIRRAPERAQPTSEFPCPRMPLVVCLGHLASTRF